MGLTIGQLALHSGVNVETIRYYERRGLITQPLKPERGYRRYPDGTVTRLRFIKRSKSLGFTLREISDLLSLSEEAMENCGNIKARAKSKIDEIKEKIIRLKSMKRPLEILSDSCGREEFSQGCPLVDALNADTKKL